MLLRNIYDEKLAQASYLLGCQSTGEALVVDPNRDIEQYLRLAKKEGLRITHVTETHIHADFASGTRELAEQTGAKMYLSAEGGPDWSYRFANDENSVLLRDGDVFNVGNIRVQVMHTPGHTPEHIIFLVTDTRSAEKPMGVFSGDFVFVGDVGRPDLLEKAAGVANTMRDGARALYGSIEKFRKLPDYLQVWPGHGAGSACGKALGAVPQTTVGYEKLFSSAFSFASEEEFADYILAGQPEPPRYFAVMKRINRDGVPIPGERDLPKHLETAALTDLVSRGATIVDVRNAVAFSRGHIKGSINIPYNRAFTGWAGALIPYDRPIVIVTDRHSAFAAREIARDLLLIGLDHLQGYFTEEVVHEQPAKEMLASVPTKALNGLLADESVQIVDVRSRSEWEAGHIPGVPNIPIAQIVDRIDELPRNKRIVMHCQSGSRSAITASFAQSRGYDASNVRGGFDEWAESGEPVERSGAAEVAT